MNVSELYQFIKDGYGEDKDELIINCLKFITDNCSPESFYGLMEIVMQDQNVDRQDMLDQFYSRVVEMIYLYLDENSIILSEQATLSDGLNIAIALELLPFYLDPQTILNITTQSIGDTDKICELLTLTGTLTVDQLLPLIDRINPNVFGRLQSIMQDKIEDNYFNEQNDEIVKNLKLLNKFYEKEFGQSSSSFFDYIKNGLPIGQKFAYYVNETHNDFNEVVTPNIDEYAGKILVLLLMSEDGYQQSLKTFRDHSSNIFSSLDILTKVDIKINNLNQKLSSFKFEVL